MSITLAQAKEKLKKYGQEHVLKYYDELSAAGQAALLEQIGGSDMDILDSCKHQEELLERGVITSFHTLRAVITATVACIGFIIGKITFQNVRNVVAPSILAASSSATGIFTKYPE